MKMNVRPFAALALATTLVFGSCKKENATNSADSDNNTETTSHADDQSQVSEETDAVTNDATLSVEGTSSFSGNVLHTTPEICDATVSFDTTGTTKKITITYDSSGCSRARIRSGSVILSMAKNVYWKNAGAALTITYQDLKIKRKHDNKTISINGSHVITNVSGGLLINLPTLGAITHTITGNMSITFGDSTQRAWQIAEKRVFSYNNGLVITVTGAHTEGSNSNIVLWGTNRFGHAFKTSITQPLVIKQDCNFRVTAGTVTHEGFGTATATYGLDANGNPASCPGTGSYHCKVIWTGLAGQAHSALFAY